MLIKLTEVCSNNTLTTQCKYTLKEVFVNPAHVVMIREDSRIRQLNEQGELLPDLAEEHSFSKLTINRGHTGTEIVVVGSPEIVETKLNKTGEQLLRG